MVSKTLSGLLLKCLPTSLLRVTLREPEALPCDSYGDYAYQPGVDSTAGTLVPVLGPSTRPPALSSSQRTATERRKQHWNKRPEVLFGFKFDGEWSEGVTPIRLQAQACTALDLHGLVIGIHSFDPFIEEASPHLFIFESTNGHSLRISSGDISKSSLWRTSSSRISLFCCEIPVKS